MIFKYSRNVYQIKKEMNCKKILRCMFPTDSVSCESMSYKKAKGEELRRNQLKPKKMFN